MDFSLQNVGIINNSTVKLDGLTVVCGSNNSGKSTIGKALYATIESLSNLESKFHNELISIYRKAVRELSKILNLFAVSEYVNFIQIQEKYDIDLSIFVELSFRNPIRVRGINVVDAYYNLKKTVEEISPEMFQNCLLESEDKLPKRYHAFINSLPENKTRAISYLEKIDKYYGEDGISYFSSISVANLFSTEFNTQVFPVNKKSDKKESIVSISQDDNIGCSFSIFDNKDISALVHENKLFINNAIYIDDPYALDKIDREEQYSFFNQSVYKSYSHFWKLYGLLLKNNTYSLIEQSINKERYQEIINIINDVLPGVITVKDSGLYYEEANKEPLQIRNLATGSKMFSIIKTLLEKGEINFDTMLILDEPEAHLHPKWQNIFAEIIVLMVKEFDTHVLLTTHSPNFLMALEAFSKKYNLIEKSNYYMVVQNEDMYMVDYKCINENLSEIYASFAEPLVEVKRLKEL